jgi:hypothetical protein
MDIVESLWQLHHFWQNTLPAQTGNNFPVEALLGYLFAQEFLLPHVLFITLMIIMLVVLINTSQRATSHTLPAVAEKQELYNKTLKSPTN